jgi:hypothetical protein
MNINYTFESSTSSAPAGFFTALAAVAAYLDSLFMDNITVYVLVGWGDNDGSGLGGALATGGPLDGQIMSYSQVRAASPAVTLTC